MQILRDLDACPDLTGGTVLTIGAYDGVHLGHRAVIAQVREQAERLGIESALVTFDRHPASVVRPESAPKLLCDLDQKLELLESTGIDIVVVVHFDEAAAAEPAPDFVRRVLVGCLQAKLVIVGADFHFGRGRHGNVALLAEMGPSLGMEVRGLELVDEHGRPARDETRVSSTAIRRALLAGDLTSANAMLGRSHRVRGVVAHGDKRGRELGFPTANVSVPDGILLPADGIYAGRLTAADGVARPTAISLGRRPTFYETAPFSLLEAHVLDFAGDLYDQRVEVEFVERLRGEERFDGVDALVAQMHRDCDRARSLLS